MPNALQWGAPSSAGMFPPRTPALLRGAGATLKSVKTGAIEGSESLSSAGSGSTDDRMFVQCIACASRDQRTHQKGRGPVFSRALICHVRFGIAELNPVLYK